MPAEHLPSWESVATLLALRLAHHADCARHPEAAPAMDCPFCDDRTAYRLWLRKSRAKLRRTLGADR